MLLSSGKVIAPLSMLADSTPIFSTSSFYSNTYLPMVGHFAAYGALYREQLWVGTVVRKLARGTARIPLQVRLGDPEGKNQLERGPLQELLDRPNPTMNGFQLKEWTSATRDVYGEAFWLIISDEKNRPRQIQPMHPRNVVVQRDPDTGEIQYVYTTGSRTYSEPLTFSADEVIPFLSYNPDSALRGVSVLEGLRATLQNEDAARRANANFWTKGARPGMILTHPNTLSEGAQERLKKRMEAAHGGADNMGGIAVFEEGIKAEVLQLSNEEMQYIESRKLNREEVCAAFDVPPPAVHILDRATFSNITENLRSVYRDTMSVKFEDYESVLMTHLVPRFYPNGDAFTQFDMSSVLRGDWETRVASALKLRQAGIGTGNQLASMVDLPTSDDPMMDKIFANAALIELGSKPTAPPAGGSQSDPFKTDDDEAEPGQGADQGQRTFRSIMGRLSRAKGNRPALKSKLIETHEQELGKYFDRQRASLEKSLGKKAASMDSQAWNADLAQVLTSLSAATARTVGDQVASDLGGDYSADGLSDWIAADAAYSAAAINSTTAAEVTKALDNADGDPRSAIANLFIGLIAARIAQMAISRVTSVSLEAGHAAARQNGGKVKRWVVAGQNPRPSHEAMDGESAPLDGVFSNGMRGPGDVSGGADEVAGCTCELDFGKE